jgi:hypothetical protein
MKRTAILLNVEYLRTLLTREMGAIQRQELMRLLADQEAKLNALNNLREVDEPIHSPGGSNGGVVSASNHPPTMRMH